MGGLLVGAALTLLGSVGFGYWLRWSEVELWRVRYEDEQDRHENTAKQLKAASEQVRFLQDEAYDALSLLGEPGSDPADVIGGLLRTRTGSLIAGAPGEPTGPDGGVGEDVEGVDARAGGDRI